MVFAEDKNLDGEIDFIKKSKQKECKTTKTNL